MATATSDNKISVSCTTEYPDYVYNEKHDIWALVTLTAPCNEEEENEEDKRAAMDIVAVIDKSGSMSGVKLKLVKRTLEFVLTQLKDGDRLAVVSYDTYVSVDFALMNMSKDKKKTALQKINNIQCGSSTNLSGGLIKGLCQIINRPSKGKNDVASVLLFTDGLANEGIQNVNGIIAAMKDPKSFDGPAQGGNKHRENSQAPAPHVSWLQRIFPAGAPKKQVNNVTNDESSKEVATSAGSATTGADASVYTFGFGSDHNADMLKKISDAGNGMYYFIETEDKIGESFAHCLGGLMSTVAQGIQLEVTMETGVVLKSVHTTRPCEQTNEQCKVTMGDLQAEENRDIVLELSLDSAHAPYDTTPQLLFNTRVNYFNVISNNLESADESLSVLRPETASVHDFKNVDAKLTKEKCRVGMTKMMKQAGDKADVGDYETSRKILLDEIESIKECQMNLRSAQRLSESFDEVYDAMLCDLGEFQANAIDEDVYILKGAKLKSNLVQQYDCQRSAMPDAKAFNSKSKKGAVLRSKSFFG